MNKVFLHCPTYDGTLVVGAASGIRLLDQALRARGDVLVVSELSGDSLVTRARDNLWTSFLLTDCTHVFFLDSDIGFDYRDVLRMIDSGLPFVVGAYPIKSDDERYCINLSSNQENLPASYYRRVNTSGTGFWMLTRAAAEQIMDHLNPDCYRHNSKDVRGVFRVFRVEPHRENHFLMSEDYFVANAYVESGGEIFVDTRIRLSHTGIKRWDGDYGAFLAKKATDAAT